jgi:16S rRNA C1402 N4-methylase RsmH
MPSLGKKLQGGISSLGKKIQSTTGTIGKKIQGVEKQVQKGISKGIDVGQNVLNKTEKGIVAASGKLGAVKQGLMTGARVLDSLQTSGIATSVPGLSLGLGAVSSALKGGAKGFQKLQDVGADARLATAKGKNQLSTVGQNVSGKVSQISGKAQARVEKVGERAKELEKQAQADLSNARSAFQG